MATIVYDVSGWFHPEIREAMKIELDLSRHCIETELKRRNNLAISRYFKADSGKENLETEIALIEKTLRTFDFQRLRSRWPLLCGGRGYRVLLVRNAAGVPTLSFENTIVTPPANPI